MFNLKSRKEEKARQEELKAIDREIEKLNFEVDMAFKNLGKKITDEGDFGFIYPRKQKEWLSELESRRAKLLA